MDQSASQEGHAEDTNMALMSSQSQTAPQNVVVGLCVLVLEITGHSRAPTRNTGFLKFLHLPVLFYFGCALIFSIFCQLFKN